MSSSRRDSSASRRPISRRLPALRLPPSLTQSRTLVLSPRRAPFEGCTAEIRGHTVINIIRNVLTYKNRIKHLCASVIPAAGGEAGVGGGEPVQEEAGRGRGRAQQPGRRGRTPSCGANPKPADRLPICCSRLLGPVRCRPPARRARAARCRPRRVSTPSPWATRTPSASRAQGEPDPRATYAHAAWT